MHGCSHEHDRVSEGVNAMTHGQGAFGCLCTHLHVHGNGNRNLCLHAGPHKQDDDIRFGVSVCVCICVCVCVCVRESRAWMCVGGIFSINIPLHTKTQPSFKNGPESLSPLCVCCC